MAKNGLLGTVRIALADGVLASSRRLSRLRDYRTRYEFTNRSSNRETLVVILAGYKEYLWPATVRRIERFVPDNFDVCVASAGVHSTSLERTCAKNSWSYLSTSRNSPGVAINTAVELHPTADYVFKVDEDIVIGADFFRLLRLGYDSVQKHDQLEPGFCAPVLNVNGVSCRNFLRTLHLTSAYEERFGPLTARCDNVPAHSDPHAAYWIWRHTLPFDEKARSFAHSRVAYSTCPTRFSIGAILLRRSFLDRIGGLESSWYAGVLGVDEDSLCKACMSLSRPIYVIGNALAGHFSFYPQEAFMRTKLPELATLDPATYPPEYYSDLNRIAQ